MTHPALLGVIDSSRRRVGIPTILGYNTKGAVQDAANAGRKRVSVFTLVSAGTLTELHGWFIGSSPYCRYQIVVYADDGSASPGAPGALVAYTAPLSTASGPGGDIELVQTGMSVSLAAGKYWIGYVCESSVTGNACYMDIGLPFPPYYNKGFNIGAAFNPPSDPFGTVDVNNSGRVLSCWAVVV